MKHLLCILIPLLFHQLGKGQSTILWEVSDTINHKQSYVIGTLHQMGNSFVDSFPKIKAALLASEMTIFESIDQVESTRNLIAKRERSDAIEKNLKKKELKALKEATQDWSVDLYRLDPLEIRWKLMQEFQRVQCHTSIPSDEFDHFDTYLMHISSENSIEMVGLETDSLQLSMIKKEYNHPDWKMERKKIVYWTDQIASNTPDMKHCALTNQYRRFELDYEFEKECKQDVLLFERNNEWMKTLPAILRTHNVFIAVGNEHLKRQCGILEQLRQAGFLVKPVTLERVDR